MYLYIFRDIKQNSNGSMMNVTVQGYNYNIRVTSPVYKFGRNV